MLAKETRKNTSNAVVSIVAAGGLALLVLGQLQAQWWQNVSPLYMYIYLAGTGGF